MLQQQQLEARFLRQRFQRAEFLLEHGMIDAIVDRRDLRNYLINTLNFCMS